MAVRDAGACHGGPLVVGATAWLALGLAVLPLAGCGGGLPATVSGKVTLSGQPLPPSSGLVTFVPVSGTGRQPVSAIKPDGSYSLASGDEQGLPLGEYFVLVAATERPDPTHTGPETAPMRLTPDKYLKKETTPFRFTIQPGHNAIDLPLAP